MYKKILPKKESCFPDKLQIFFLIILLMLVMGLWRATPDAFGADVYVDASNTGLENGSKETPDRSMKTHRGQTYTFDR